jgi:acetoin utilization deacetylase AcuC-like enzyme
MDPRRADYVIQYLLDEGVVHRQQVRVPRRVRYQELARVHTAPYLESLFEGPLLSDILGVDVSELPVGETLRTLRLACGGTLEATEVALASGRPALNLLGGFHHAAPSRGGGFSVFNDVAVAVAAQRERGFSGAILVLDLDAHPPDGLAACLAGYADFWIGSISAVDWGPLPGVDETVLGAHCGDSDYLQALDALLQRMPAAGLAFVIAGADILLGDRGGGLRVTLEGARQRDLRVVRALGDVPTVWVPGGGYGPAAWRCLAGTARALAQRSLEDVPETAGSLRSYFGQIAEELHSESLKGDAILTEADLLSELGQGHSGDSRLLGYYSTEGIEYGLHRYGILRYLRRLGFDDFRVTLDHDEQGDRLRVFGRSENEHLLIDCLLEQRLVANEHLLYIHWLSLQNPMGQFGGKRTRLPGQQAPGLGLAREAGALFTQMAQRLKLSGFAFAPAWFHTAYVARNVMHFADASAQGRFEALVAALARFSLFEATQAVAAGRVLLNGKPYQWESGIMVHWLDGRAPDQQLVSIAREKAHFAIKDAALPR